jgi:rhamnulokinase
MSARHFLAFDLGAESGRAVLGSLESGRLRTKEIHRFPNVPIRILGHWHWDVYRLFAEIRRALALAAAEVPDGLESVGVDTWGVDFGLLARDGSLLGLPTCYRDERHSGAMEDFLRLMPREQVYELTGVHFLPFNTLYQIYALVRERSPLLDAAADLLFMPDLFNYLLTSRKATEFTIATTSQFYDPRRREWVRGLFQGMGLSKQILQEVREPGTVLAPLLPEVAADAGLRRAVPVVSTASHDTGAAVAAVPAEGEDWAFISSGTWSLVGVEEREAVVTAAALAHNFTNEGGVGRTIRFLRNVSGLWLVQQCRRAWSRDGELGYEELTRRAAEAPPFQALLDPDAPEFLNPPDMPAALEAYWKRTGQKPPADRAGVVRSIFESLALKYRQVLDELREVTGRTIRRVHVIGGGSRNALLSRFTAEATGLPVVAGPAEGTAAGNILVQAMAVGAVSSLADLRGVVRRSTELVSYEPLEPHLWDAPHEKFRALTAP